MRSTPTPAIIKSTAYCANQSPRQVSIDDLTEVLQEPDTLVWVSLYQPDDALMKKIQQKFNLHELAIEDALKAHQRPKLEVYGDSLFMVIHTAPADASAAATTLEYGEAHLFVGRNFLITIQHGAMSIDTLARKRVEENPRLLGQGSGGTAPGFALYAVLDSIVDQYRTIVGQFEERFDRLEEQLFSKKAEADFDQSAVEALYGLRRSLLELHNAAFPVEDICNQLIRFHETLIPKELRAYVRDIQDHVHQVSVTSDSLRDTLANAVQAYLTLVSVKQNEITKALAGWGAILAVPTVVFSLYGMNFSNIPLVKSPWGFTMTVLFTAAGCVYLYRKLKRAGWL